jgi:hypothetical protein
MTGSMPLFTLPVHRVMETIWERAWGGTELFLQLLSYAEQAGKDKALKYLE